MIGRAFWQIFKRGPTYGISLVIVSSSAIVFLFWWQFRSPWKLALFEREARERQAYVRKMAAKVEAEVDKLILADNHLYNVQTGELVFGDWTSRPPLRLLSDKKANGLIGRYELGFVRFGFDGSEEGGIGDRSSGFSVDGKQLCFAKRDKDIYLADIDWRNFEPTGERKITSVGVFNHQHFRENVLVHTEKTLIVRNVTELLRIDLETGGVKRAALREPEILLGRSPSHKYVIGNAGGELGCYEVDSESGVKTGFKVGRTSNFLWLGDDKCLFISGGKSLQSFDRRKNTVSKVCDLPAGCNALNLPSANKRYVLCKGRRGGIVCVDLKQGKAYLTVAQNAAGWIADDAFVFDRDVSDSQMRGTWIQMVGGKEQRLDIEPFLIDRPVRPIAGPAASFCYINRHGLVVARWDGVQGEIVNLIKGISSFTPMEEFSPF